ncbi:ORF6N domain-containing protein [Candidatus Saccharibacteria bacterium]|nr:ORF6N domain-containing protein [Candidatus Saccharibacteria bacterium]
MTKRDGARDLDITNWDIRNKIYDIRGQKVMLDYDLARFYGYTTKALNQQVKRNLDKFEGSDFMFRLNEVEVSSFLRSQIVTSKTDGRGGKRYLPYAFTEQGIYMLMTILKGDLATKQSRSLVMAFKAMKDYIIDNQKILDCRNNLRLAMKVADNAERIAVMEGEFNDISADIGVMKERLNTFIKKSEISPFLRAFGKDLKSGEFLICEGELTKASETYIDIFCSARKSVEIIDDYVDIKTLRYLQKIKSGVTVTIYTENIGHYLHERDLQDYRKEFPGIVIRFVKSLREFHDRFIIIDRGDNDGELYHCGASLKDSGTRLTVISIIKDAGVAKEIFERVDKMARNPELPLPN